MKVRPVGPFTDFGRGSIRCLLLRQTEPPLNMSALWQAVCFESMLLFRHKIKLVIEKTAAV